MPLAAKSHTAMVLASVFLASGAGCTSPGKSLDGTQWRLAVWTLSSFSAGDFAISASFEDGKLSGRSAVNHYAGPYTLGPGNAFSAGPFATTRMAGPEPAMRAEGGYLQLLEQAKSYKLAGGKLTLYDAGGNESLSFEPASDSGSPGARCVESGAQCQLPDGPLGVCERAACAPGAAPPCFQCTPQH